MAKGDFAAAQPLLERSLLIREGVYGLNHLDTVTALSNLGLLLWDGAIYSMRDVCSNGPRQ